MQFISKLPWWAAFPLSGGLTLMGIFSPDAVPQWLRITLFWAGVGLALVGLMAATWHFRPRGWLARNLLWRFKLRAPLPATEGGDTLRATGTVSDPTPEAALSRLLHVGYILPSIDKLKDGGFIELCIVAYNASSKTLALSDVRGNIRLTVKDGEEDVVQKLAVPDLIRIAPKRQIAPFSEFVMTLHQTVDERLALLIRGALRKKGSTLELENLMLEFEPYQELGPKVRLPIWDGIRIADSGPRLCRVIMLRVTETISASSTAGDAQ